MCLLYSFLTIAKFGKVGSTVKLSLRTPEKALSVLPTP